MKKGLKLIPFALAALVLVGCSSKPIGPQNGKDPIIDKDGLSYQEFYDELYKKHNGSEKAAEELIDKIAKDVVTNSTKLAGYATENGVEKLVNDRRNEVLDDFYTSTYKKDGLFNEELLVKDLIKKGFNIKVKDGKDGDVYYHETEDNLLGFDKLSSKLNEGSYDYTDYFTKKADHDIYVQLLKEDYILTQKDKYFTDKRIRKVQYFSFSTESSSTDELIQAKIEAALKDVTTITEEEFFNLAKDTFYPAVNEIKLKEVAKDYSYINEKQDYTSSDYEFDYMGNYKELYTEPGVINPALSDTEKEEIISKMNSYTNNGVYTKEHGYTLKQLEVKGNLGYGEGFIASDDNSGSLVQSDIDALIKKSNLEDKIIGSTEDNKLTSGLLDYKGNGAKVFKEGNAYYVVRVEIIDANTTGADKIDGARALTKNSTNTKNAVADYLKEKKVNVYEETLFNYLKDTYGFSKK